MRTPHGLEEIKQLYGDPSNFIREDGTVSPLWDRRMVAVQLPAAVPLGWGSQTVTRVRVNEVIAPEVERLMRSWHDAHLWERLKTYDGGYVWRAKRGSNRLSLHAFGGALDFNAATNQLGTVGDMDHDLVGIAEALGWTWGGRWRRPDPMHFQYAAGY